MALGVPLPGVLPEPAGHVGLEQLLAFGQVDGVEEPVDVVAPAEVLDLLQEQVTTPVEPQGRVVDALRELAASAARTPQ